MPLRFKMTRGYYYVASTVCEARRGSGCNPHSKCSKYTTTLGVALPPSVGAMRKVLFVKGLTHSCSLRPRLRLPVRRARRVARGRVSLCLSGFGSAFVTLLSSIANNVNK